MITDATLLVNRPQLLTARGGGLTAVERQLHTLARAGITRVWINAHRPERLSELRLPDGLELLWSDQKTREIAPPYLVVSGDHFVLPETVAYVAAAGYSNHTSFNDESNVAVLQVVPRSLDISALHDRQPMPARSSVFLDPPLNHGPTLSWLLALGPKSADGFMARHFDRHISLAATRRLLDAPVSPMLMTLASAGVGLCGAALFTIPARNAEMAGAALVWLHSVLDGCDGELARIRMAESPLGARVDFWADNLVHAALFSALGLGRLRAGGGLLAAALGFCAAAASLGCAFLEHRRRSDAAPSSGAQAGTLARVERILVQRDFIYLLLVMAFWDMTGAFLWAAAVGTPLFFILMLTADRGRDTAAPRAQNA